MTRCRYKGYHIEIENGEACIFTPQGKHVASILATNGDDAAKRHAQAEIRERISENRDKPA